MSIWPCNHDGQMTLRRPSARSRTSYGGTAPERVREQVAAAKRVLGRK
jgi:hypothetical protein